MEKDHSNLKVINYGDNKFYNEFINSADKELMAGIERCGGFYIEEELKVLESTYEIMQEIQNLDKEDKAHLHEITDKFRNTAADVMDLIQFVELNREILKHLLEKIDKQTQAFENVNMKTFFIEAYKKKDSTLKHLLEHPGLLRVYFQIKYLYDKLVNETGYKGFAGSGNKKDKNGKSLKEMDINDINKFDENDEEMNFANGKGGFKDHETEIKRNIKRIQAYLSIQSSFFQVHSEDVFKQIGLSVNDYCNIDKLRDKAEQNYNNKKLTKEEFIALELEYEKKDEEEQKLKPCYSMIDLWLVLIHTCLYVMPYYGLALTSSTYATALALPATLSGILQAATPVAAILGGFFFNHITRHNKYRGPYFVSLSLMFIGMILYYIPYAMRNSNQAVGIVLLIIGRMSFGIGGSRLMTRKYLAINVEIWAQSTYSTIFVGLSACAMSVGPGIAAILLFANNADLGITETFGGNIMAFMFIFVYGACLIIFFFVFQGYDKKLDNVATRLELNDHFLNVHENEFEQSTLQGMRNKDAVGKNRRFKVSHLPKVSGKYPELSSSNLHAFKNERNNKVPLLKAYFPNGMTVYTVVIFTVFKSWLISDPRSLFHRSSSSVKTVLQPRCSMGRVLLTDLDCLCDSYCVVRSLVGQENGRQIHFDNRNINLHSRNFT